MGLFLDVRAEGSGPPLVLQAPAWGPSSDYLRLTLTPLLKGFRVVSYDPRNVGDSARVEGTRSQAAEYLVADLESLRADLDLDRFVLVGHSHGGFIALAYAVRHAPRLSGLVLLNTTVRRAIGAEEVEENLRTLAGDPERRGAVELFRATGGRPPRVDGDADLARWMRRLTPAYFYDLDAMARFVEQARGARPPSARALAGIPDDLEPWVEAGVSSLKVPTLVVGGRFDVATPPAAARHIHSLLPTSRLEIFERSGHHPWVDEPLRFEATLREFLRDIDYDAGSRGSI